MVNNQSFDVAGIEQHNYMVFLGTAPDGGFYVAGMGAHSEDNAVQHYSEAGHLLGVARPPKNDFYAEDYHNLAVGPDGDLYALISLSDQDVVIVRLNFNDELPVLPTTTPFAEWTPMPPLSPAWETPPFGATNQEIAQNTVITFLALLDERRYTEAGELYGGGMEGFEPYCEEYPDFCTHLASLQDTPDQFWQAACSNLLACFSIGQIVEVETISETEFRFWVELIWEDGYKYVAHACCGGNPAITPFVWLYPFTVREVNDQFQVLDPPPPLK
jgi:hypothetical protein